MRSLTFEHLKLFEAKNDQLGYLCGRSGVCFTTHPNMIFDRPVLGI